MKMAKAKAVEIDGKMAIFFSSDFFFSDGNSDLVAFSNLGEEQIYFIDNEAKRKYMNGAIQKMMPKLYTRKKT